MLKDKNNLERKPNVRLMSTDEEKRSELNPDNGI